MDQSAKNPPATTKLLQDAIKRVIGPVPSRCQTYNTTVMARVNTNLLLGEDKKYFMDYANSGRYLDTTKLQSIQLQDALYSFLKELGGSVATSLVGSLAQYHCCFAIVEALEEVSACDALEELPEVIVTRLHVALGNYLVAEMQPWGILTTYFNHPYYAKNCDDDLLSICNDLEKYVAATNSDDTVDPVDSICIPTRHTVVLRMLTLCGFSTLADVIVEESIKLDTARIVCSQALEAIIKGMPTKKMKALKKYATTDFFFNGKISLARAAWRATYPTIQESVRAYRNVYNTSKKKVMAAQSYQPPITSQSLPRPSSTPISTSAPAMLPRLAPTQEAMSRPGSTTEPKPSHVVTFKLNGEGLGYLLVESPGARNQLKPETIIVNPLAWRALSYINEVIYLLIYLCNLFDRSVR